MMIWTLVFNSEIKKWRMKPPLRRWKMQRRRWKKRRESKAEREREKKRTRMREARSEVGRAAARRRFNMPTRKLVPGNLENFGGMSS
jgi:hypothetical protein